MSFVEEEYQVIALYQPNELQYVKPGDRAEFAAWRADNASWLDDYTLFMALERAHGGE